MNEIHIFGAHPALRNVKFPGLRAAREIGRGMTFANASEVTTAAIVCFPNASSPGPQVYNFADKSDAAPRTTE